MSQAVLFDSSRDPALDYTMRYILKAQLPAILVAALCHCTVCAAVTISEEPRKWQPMALDVAGPSATEMDDAPNPFLDYRFNVRYTSPSGKIFVVPGFFAGDGSGGGSGNVWRSRFLPDEPGRWTYDILFRQGPEVAVSLEEEAGSPVMSVDGLSGSFDVGKVPADAKGYFARGRLLNTEGWYRRFQDGTHYLKAGADSPENLFSFDEFDWTGFQLPRGRTRLHYDPHYDPPGGHVDWEEGDPLLGDTEATDGRELIGAINYLAGKNVNSLYFLPMNIGGDGQDTAPYPVVADASGGGGADDSGNDNLRFDIERMEQWNVVMQHAAAKGMQLHLVLNEAEEPNKRELDNAESNADGTPQRERRLYYREMVARFGYLPAVQWNISEEYDHDLDLGEEKVKGWAKFMADLDPYDHAIAVHNQGTYHQKKKQYRQFLKAGSPFTSTSIQDRGGDNFHAGDVIENIRADAAARGGPIPVYLDEHDDIQKDGGTSGGQNASPEDTRRTFIWPCYFSGASGIELYMGKNDRSIDNFREFEDTFEWMQIAHKFMTGELPFWEMEPADDLLTDESTYARAGGLSADAEVFAKAGEIYAIYFPRAAETGTLQLPTESWTLRWFNPRTGEFAGDAVPLNGGAAELPAPPRDAGLDWVALIKK